MAAFAALVWRGIGTVGLAKPDVIVGSSPHLFAALAAEKVARRFRVSFVLEVRDLWPQTLVDFGLYSTNHPVVRVLESIERRLYRGAERIIVLSPGAVDYMIRKGVSDGRVVWLPNGVDLGLVPEPTIPGTGETFTVMYAGAHGIANGLDTVLDAAAILQEEGWGARVRFRLIGDGLEKPRLESRVRRESLKAVFLEPPVPKSQIYRLLQDADALIFTLKKSPIYRWGFSLNKLFDYFASARPIICAADSPYDPVTETNAGLTVPSEDPLAIAQAVKRLAQMPSVERWRMGLRGRSYVEEHHDLSQLTDKFEEILYDAITARHAFA